MTLLSFATHVVLGCCAHHRHEWSAKCCHGQEVAQSNSQQAVIEALPGCCSHHGSSGKERASHEQSLEVSSIAVSVLAPERPLSSPCGHSHNCEGEDCIYLNNGADLGDWSQGLTGQLCFLCTRCAIATNVVREFAGAISLRDEARVCFSQPQCAMYQSWQI